jgi:hypothetical protein
VIGCNYSSEQQVQAPCMTCSEVLRVFYSAIFMTNNLKKVGILTQVDTTLETYSIGNVT